MIQWVWFLKHYLVVHYRVAPSLWIWNERLFLLCFQDFYVNVILYVLQSHICFEKKKDKIYTQKKKKRLQCISSMQLDRTGREKVDRSFNHGQTALASLCTVSGKHDYMWFYQSALRYSKHFLNLGNFTVIGYTLKPIHRSTYWLTDHCLFHERMNRLQYFVSRFQHHHYKKYFNDCPSVLADWKSKIIYSQNTLCRFFRTDIFICVCLCGSVSVAFW